MLSNRGRDIVDRRIEAERRRASELGAGLRALSPLATLARGYAIAQLPDGSVLRDAAHAPAGTALRLTVEEGTLATRSEGGVPDTVPHGASTSGRDTADDAESSASADRPLDDEAPGDGVSVGRA